MTKSHSHIITSHRALGTGRNPFDFILRISSRNVSYWKIIDFFLFVEDSNEIHVNFHRRDSDAPARLSQQGKPLRSPRLKLFKTILVFKASLASLSSSTDSQYSMYIASLSKITSAPQAARQHDGSRLRTADCGMRQPRRHNPHLYNKRANFTHIIYPLDLSLSLSLSHTHTHTHTHNVRCGRYDETGRSIFKREKYIYIFQYGEERILGNPRRRGTSRSARPCVVRRNSSANGPEFLSLFAANK